VRWLTSVRPPPPPLTAVTRAPALNANAPANFAPSSSGAPKAAPGVLLRDRDRRWGGSPRQRRAVDGDRVAGGVDRK